MHNLNLERFDYGEKATFSMLNINNVDHVPIFTLENPWLDNQEYISCIPEGVYMCEPFNGAKYKNVYEVTCVPNRTYVLIHIGNYPEQTEGCILPGLGCDPSAEVPMVYSSGDAMRLLRETLQQETFQLTITSK